MEIQKKEEELEKIKGKEEQKSVEDIAIISQELLDLLDIRNELFCVLLNSKILLADNSNITGIVSAALPLL